jgi:hypothetical protein
MEEDDRRELKCSTGVEVAIEMVRCGVRSLGGFLEIVSIG